MNMDLNKDIEIYIEKFFNNNNDFALNKCFMQGLLSQMNNPDYIFDAPISAHLRITSACNLRCKHCYFKEYPEKFCEKNNLNIEQILKTIDEAAELGVNIIVVTGGEPFLHSHIFDILEKIKSLNMAFYIQTNGVLITDEIAAKLNKVMVPNMDNIQVSLEGSCPETNDAIRGKDAFSGAIKGIKFLVKNDIDTFINCTVTALNTKELYDIYSLATELRVKKMYFNKFVPFSKQQEYLIPDTEAIFRSMSSVIKAENPKTSCILKCFKIFDFVNFSPAEKILATNKATQLELERMADKTRNCMCHRGQKMDISANGNVYLCSAATADEFCLGNIKQNSLLDIWQNRHKNIFFKEKIYDDMPCKKCKYFDLCNGNCSASAYEKYGTIYAPDKLCKIGEKFMPSSNL